MTKTLTLSLLAVLLFAPASEARPRKAAAKPAATKASASSSGPSRVEACKARFAASCAAMQRCALNAEDLGGQRCEAIDPGCDRLGGKASYTAAQVEACVAGLQQVTCRARVDPFTFDVEAQVPACKAMDLADARPAARGADTTVTASR